MPMKHRFMFILVPVLLFWLLSGSPLLAGEHHYRVYTVEISGEVSPTMAAYVKRALSDIPDGDNQLIVMKMDTFGGRVDSALTIVDLIVNCRKGETIAFVTKKAISAGALIALACDGIVMKPHTTIGDCAPIMVDSKGPRMMGEKFQSPLRAKFRSLARKNGYPEALAEAMVTADMEVYRVVAGGRTVYIDDVEYAELDKSEKAKITSKKTVVKKGELLTMDDTEALKFGFSRMTASGLADMLRSMGITSYDIVPVKRSWSESFLRLLGTIAPLLMLVGLGAVYTEIKAPGFGAPGIVGIICLALFFMHQYAVGLAGYTELLLVLLGFVLVALELFVLPGFGIAGIGGILCIITGLVLSLQGFVLPDPAMPWQTDLMVSNVIEVLSAVLAAFLVALFILRFVLPRLSVVVKGPYLETTLHDARADSRAVGGARAGDVGVAVTPLRPSGKVKVGDAVYDVVTEGGFLEKGARVVITAIRGNTITVTGEGER